MVKNLQKQSKKKKKRKKEQNFSSFVRLHNKRTKRERKQRREKKKDAREHNQRQTNDDERTATHRGGEVREGVERAESGRVREGALLFFLLLRNSSS